MGKRVGQVGVRLGNLGECFAMLGGFLTFAHS